MTLNQLGVGPVEGFVITDANATWNDLIQDTKKIEAIKSYVYLKVKLMFDPPASSTVIDSIKNQIQELEWRITTMIETSKNINEVT